MLMVNRSPDGRGANPCRAGDSSHPIGPPPAVNEASAARTQQERFQRLACKTGGFIGTRRNTGQQAMVNALPERGFIARETAPA